MSNKKPPPRITAGPAGAPVEIDFDLFVRKYSGEAESGPGYQYLREEICRVQNRNRARKRKGKKGSLRDAIERLVTVTGLDSLGGLLEAIDENDELIPELFHSIKDPIHITDVEIVHESRKIHYRTRWQSPKEEPKKVTFDRLDNILREIRKTR